MRGILVTLSVLASGLPLPGLAQDAPSPEAVPQPAGNVPSHIVFDEPVEVKRYLLTVAAAEARAYAEALEMGIPSAETQAVVLASNLRVLNETPIDALPEEHQAYIKGLREIRNDITPRIMAAFLSVASGSLAEKDLTAALAPLERELYERETALEAAHPEAAAAMGRKGAQKRAFFISLMILRPEDPPEVQKKGPVSRKERAAWNRRLAEKIEECLK